MTVTNPNPSGLCRCGCGERTNLAPKNHKATGIVKGLPQRYIAGHQRRLSPIEYVEQDCGYKTPCWVWQRAKTELGYGVARADGKNQYAHRMMYEREVGPIPDGLSLDHLCRNPSCVNPAHLEPVTHGENLRRGAGTRLTDVDVRNIRKRRAAGEKRVALASEYLIDTGYLDKVIARKVWTDVE